jgi:regulator of protease activity HflC (stomatin/prohibitin superfamily)
VSHTDDLGLHLPAPQVREHLKAGIPGLLMLLLGVLLLLAGAALVLSGLGVANLAPEPLAAIGLAPAAGGLAVASIVIGVFVFILGWLTLKGLNAVAPGEARVLQLFGRYSGTVRQDGLRWVNPFFALRKVSTRIRNHETATLKVNDADGNPIEIAAVVVWQVADTARAVFEVDDFAAFVAIQTETAVRHIANGYPYDAHNPNQLSLRDNADEITAKLSTEVAARVVAAGVRIVESRITHLAYSPEIAQAMLRRQQAGAVVAARQQIVEGAVGMVKLALDRLDESNVVQLDEERKAAMVSNLLVVLCGDRAAQPVLNTGTLYQ